MKKDSFKNNILKYSLLFGFFVGIILIIFKIYDKSFVWVNVSNDGLDQHLVNLHLFKNLLLDFFKTGNLATFTWQIGYGMDMFANYAYYVFGDFLAYLVVFIPDKLIPNFYNFLVIARLYLVGISYLVYCRHKKLDSFSSLIGSLIYTFSSFSLFAMARHPYFINALVIFPLVLMFTEKIIKDDKKIGFILMVFLLFITSFYFGYMIALLIALYGIILAFHEYKGNYRLIIKKLLITFGCAVVGLLMASIIIIPTLNAFLSSTRTGDSLYFYSIKYYLNLIPSLITVKNVGNWSLIGVSSLFLVIIPAFLAKRKQYKNIFQYLVCLLLPLVIPILGTLLAGLSYPNNRWAFVITFFFSLIVTMFLNNKENISNKKTIPFILIYGLICLIVYRKVNLQIIISILCALGFVQIFRNKDKLKEKFKPLLMIILIVNIGFNICYLYSKKGLDYAKEFVGSNPKELYKNANGDIPYLKEACEYLKSIDDSYYNVLVSSTDLYNLSLMNNYNSISYFYSIVNGNYLNLATDLENQELGINKEIKNFNYRTKITTLLNNKYLITTNNLVPYGYKLIKNYNNETFIYQNTHSLTFASLYTSKINKEVYDNLSPLEKESYLLKTTVLDEENFINSRLKENKELLSSIEKIDYNILNNTILNNNKVISTKENNKISLKIDNINQKELYINISNINFEGNLLDGKDYKITVDINSNAISEKTNDPNFSPYYFENNNLLINLGYFEKFSGVINITFNTSGTYTFDKLEVVAINFDDYVNDINNLKRANFKLNEYRNNYLSGTINALESGILQFATNYSDGWKVLVDGKERETFVSNNYFLGINIDEGFHKIEMIYETPNLKLGFICSTIGILSFISLSYYEIIINKREK